MKIIKKTLAIVLTALMLVSAIPLNGFAETADSTEKQEETVVTVEGIQVFDVQIATQSKGSDCFDIPEFSYKLIYSDGKTEVKSSAEKDENLVVSHNQDETWWTAGGQENYIHVSYLGAETTVNVDIIDNYYEYYRISGGVEIREMSSKLKGEVEIPAILGGEKVISIEDMSKKITHLIIPKTVKKLPSYLLTEKGYAAKLEKITVHEDNSKYSSHDGVLYNKDKTKVLAIPYARKDDVKLHKSVKKIGDLKADKITVKVHSDSEYFSSKNGIIYNKDKTEVIYANKNIKGSYAMPSTVKKISESAFANCDELTSVKVSNAVTTITYKVFYSCDSLKKITLPKNLKTIKGNAFERSGLEKITIPDTVTTIGNWAFANCKKLKTVKLGDSLKTIGGYCFTNTSVKEITIPGKVKTIGGAAFYDCKKLTTVTLGKSVKTINWSAFENTKIKKITIPNSVKEIGSSAFGNCKKLKKVSIGSGLKDLEANVFYDCNKLDDVSISAKNKNLSCDGSAIYRKTDNSTILYFKQGQLGYIVKDGTKTIENPTFSTNTAASSLKTLILPNSVTGLTYDNFFSCVNLTSLTSITLPNKTQGVKWDTFYNSKKLVSVTIPKTVTRISYNAFNNKIKHVFYAGSKKQWKKIQIDTPEMFKNATIHYNSKGCEHKYSKGADLTCNICGYFEILPTTRTVKGKTYYYVNGKKNTSFTGVVEIDGKDKFFKKGVLKSNLDVPKVELKNTKKGVKVTWSKVTAAKKYVVYRQFYSNGKWSKNKVVETTTSRKFTDKVKSGKRVRYTVYAYNGKIKSKTNSGAKITTK